MLDLHHSSDSSSSEEGVEDAGAGGTHAALIEHFCDCGIISDSRLQDAFMAVPRDAFADSGAKVID